MPISSKNLVLILHQRLEGPIKSYHRGHSKITFMRIKHDLYTNIPIPQQQQTKHYKKLSELVKASMILLPLYCFRRNQEQEISQQLSYTPHIWACYSRTDGSQTISSPQLATTKAADAWIMQRTLLLGRTSHFFNFFYYFLATLITIQTQKILLPALLVVADLPALSGGGKGRP